MCDSIINTNVSTYNAHYNVLFTLKEQFELVENSEH